MSWHSHSHSLWAKFCKFIFSRFPFITERNASEYSTLAGDEHESTAPQRGEDKRVNIPGFIVVLRASLEQLSALNVEVIVPGENDVRKVRSLNEETGKYAMEKKSSGNSGATTIAAACKHLLDDIRVHRVRVSTSNKYSTDNFDHNVITPAELEYFQLRSEVTNVIAFAQANARAAPRWQPMLETPFVDPSIEVGRRRIIEV
jgi:hypothetical protein